MSPYRNHAGDATMKTNDKRCDHYPNNVDHRICARCESELLEELPRIKAERDAAVRTAERIDDKWQEMEEQRNAERARADKAEATFATADERAHAVAQLCESRTSERNQARAEADALRAEVAALRGLPDSDKALVSFMLAHRNDYSNEANAAASLRAALATVPPAKVADMHPDALRTIRCGWHDGLRRCTRGSCHVGPHEWETKAPKPESEGLEPLDGTATLWDVIVRVNKLSAIAKRGGL